MFCKATTALIALLAFCFAPPVLADAGSLVGPDRVFAKSPVSTMFNGSIGAVNGAAWTFATGKEAAFAASPLLPRVRFSRSGGVGKAKPWIKLTGPLGDQVYINVEQIISVRPDTEISGAKTQIDFTSGKFQRVREDIEQVMQSISATPDAQENGET